MKKSSQLLSVFACLTFAVLSCGVDSCSTPTDSGSVEITILHTNDIHSHLRAEPGNSEKNPFHLGGLARLKTLIDQIRSSKKNTILLDAGDWSEAVAYFTIDAGSNMLSLMSAMGYNAVVVGNHDFLNGPVEMASTVERAKPSFPVLGANMDLTQVPDRARISSLIKPSTVITVGGIRVGIIGALCDDLEYSPNFKPGLITNVFDAVSAQAKNMHDNNLADVIVMLSHNAFAKQVTWAKTIPWINVVVSGHSHAKTAQPVQLSNGGNKSYVVEAKQWGQFLGDLTLVVNKSTGRITMKDYTLHPVTADLAEDSKIAAMVNQEDQRLAAKFGNDIAHDHAADCADEMVHDDVREVPLVNFSADAYRLATGAQMAMESVQLTGVGIQPGSLSSMDLINIAPHIYGPVPGKPFPRDGSVWTLKNVRLRGLELRALLNISLLAPAIGLPVGWTGLSGMRVTYSAATIAQAARLEFPASATPVKTIQVLNPMTGDYDPIDDFAVYTVGLHDGVILAIQSIIDLLHLGIDLSNRTETGIQTWQAVTAFGVSRQVIRAADFEPGVRYHPVEADIGFYEHNFKVTDGPNGLTRTINIRVKNEGLTTTQPGFRLHALRGAPDDAVNDYTAGNENISIGDEVSIPVLAPNETAVISLPWTDLPGAATYALKIELLGADANPHNNSITVHAHITGLPPAVKKFASASKSTPVVTGPVRKGH